MLSSINTHTKSGNYRNDSFDYFTGTIPDKPKGMCPDYPTLISLKDKQLILNEELDFEQLIQPQIYCFFFDKDFNNTYTIVVNVIDDNDNGPIFAPETKTDFTFPEV